jgi:Ca2+-binding EF-hand superfamily protein
MKSKADLHFGNLETNSKGGVWISDAELRYGAKYFGDGERISRDSFKKSVEKMINQKISDASVEELFHSKEEINIDQLHNLIDNNEIKDFDPIYEAFRLVHAFELFLIF